MVLDTAMLQSLLAAEVNTEGMTPETVRAYQDAKKAAEDLLKSVNEGSASTTQESINQAASDLLKAIAGLRPEEKIVIPEYAVLDALNEAVRLAEAIDRSKYEQEALIGLDGMVACAKTMLNARPQKELQKLVDDMAAMLNRTREGLKEKNTEQKPKPPAAGKTYDVGTLRYKVVKSAAAGGTVTVEKLLKAGSTKVVIPSAVELDGYEFQVTKISAEAFQKRDRIKTLVIGENLASIGKKSFYQCKSLKSITFQGKKAPKIGGQAFKGIKAGCKVFVPKKMAKKQFMLIKSRMKKAGAGNKVIYKKK